MGIFNPKKEAQTMEELSRKVALLESVNDQLVTELEYVDALLKEVGFTEGLATIKQAAREFKEHRDCQDLY